MTQWMCYSDVVPVGLFLESITKVKGERASGNQAEHWN